MNCRGLQNRLVWILLAALPLVLPVSVSAEEVTVGVLLPLSGPQAGIGHMQKNSMILAAKEVNRRGGIGGRTLELDFRDTGGRARNAAPIIDHFVNDKSYPVILGGGGSRFIEAAAVRSERLRVPFIAVTGSEDDISRKGRRYTFRVAPPRSRYAAAAMDYVKEVVRPQITALLTDGSPFADDMTTLVGTYANREGWDLVHGAEHEPGTMNLEEDYVALVDAGPDVLFLMLFPPDAGRVTVELKKRLRETVLVNLAPASTLAVSMAECKDSCAGVMSPALWWRDRSLASRRYHDEYVKLFGMEPDYHGAQAYAAVTAASAAMKRAGTEDRESLRDALSSLRVSTPYGAVAFDEWGGYTNQNSPENFLVQWDGGRFEVIWPESARKTDGAAAERP